MRYYKVENDIVIETDVISNRTNLREKLPNVVNPSEAILNSYGYYKYVIPEYDINLNEPGDFYFDSQQLIVSRYVLVKTLNLTEVKQDKVKRAGIVAMRLLFDTEIFIKLNTEAGINLPQSIRKDRDDILIAFNDHKTAILALNTLAEVFDYNITY